MTTLALRYFKIQKGLKSQMNSISYPQVNWKLSLYVLSSLIVMLLLFYVWQINELTRGSYTINSYAKEVNSLMQQNKDLEVSFAESSFMGESLAKVQALHFQDVTSVKYIQVLDGSLASAQQIPAN